MIKCFVRIYRVIHVEYDTTVFDERLYVDFSRIPVNMNTFMSIGATVFCLKLVVIMLNGHCLFR